MELPRNKVAGLILIGDLGNAPLSLYGKSGLSSPLPGNLVSPISTKARNIIVVVCSYNMTALRNPELSAWPALALSNVWDRPGTLQACMNARSITQPACASCDGPPIWLYLEDLLDKLVAQILFIRRWLGWYWRPAIG